MSKIHQTINNINHVCIRNANFFVKLSIVFITALVFASSAVGGVVLLFIGDTPVLQKVVLFVLAEVGAFVSAYIVFFVLSLLGAWWFVLIGIYERLGESNNLLRQVTVNTMKSDPSPAEDDFYGHL